MSRSDGPTSEERGNGDPVAPEAADWLAASTLRIALTVLGLFIVLFAIGQVVGFDLLEIVLDALNTATGRWLIIAFVGLLLIALAFRGFDSGSE